MNHLDGTPFWLEPPDEAVPDQPAPPGGPRRPPPPRPTSRAVPRQRLRSRLTAPRLTVAVGLIGVLVAWFAARATRSDAGERDRKIDREAAVQELTTATGTALSVAENVVLGRTGGEARNGPAAPFIQTAYDQGRAPLVTGTQTALARLGMDRVSGPARARAAAYASALVDAYDLAAEPSLPGERRYAHDAALRAREVDSIRGFLRPSVVHPVLGQEQWESIRKGKGAPVLQYPAFEDNYVVLIGAVRASLAPIQSCLAAGGGNGCG